MNTFLSHQKRVLDTKTGVFLIKNEKKHEKKVNVKNEKNFVGIFM